MPEANGMITHVEDIDWENRLAARARRMKSSVIRELLKLTAAAGPHLLRRRAAGARASSRSASSRRPAATSCRTTVRARCSTAPPRATCRCAEWLAGDDVQVRHLGRSRQHPDDVNGSQQALDLIGKLFVDPDTCVVCSRPTYLGALQAWNAYEACYCTVPQDDDGMMVEEIPALLDKGKHRPRFVYVLPNFHNPAGTTLSLARRERLVEIARRTTWSSSRTIPTASCASRARTSRPSSAWRPSAPST